MFIGFSPASLVDLVQAHLAILVGKMYFGPLDSCILILALAAALLSALNLWRIGNREDREKRLFHALRRVPLRRADPLRMQRLPWYQRLGTKIASTKIIGTAEQKSLLAALVAAGIKGHGHLAALIAGKFCGGATLVPLCWLVLEWRQWFVGAPTLRFAVLAGASILGWRCPVTLQPPNSGVFSGLLLIQDSASAIGAGVTYTSGGSSFDAGSGMHLTGLLYFPENAVNFHGNPGTTCSVLIAKAVTIGNSNFSTSGCASAGLPNLPTVNTVALAE